MRLICPNCDAQYEVADNVIPDEGRDVQCSNCGTTWFQDSAASMLAAESADFAADDGENAGFEDEIVPAADNAPSEAESGATDDDAPESKDDIGDQPENDTPPVDDETEDDATGLPQSTVSDEAAKVLREEALRELKARLAEGSAVESQGDLGISEPPPKPRAVPPEPVQCDTPTADVPTPEPVPEPDDRASPEAVAGIVGSSRDRLPDIEEINSTLTATTARKATENDGGTDAIVPGGRRRTGFRVGFVLAILIAVGGLGLYVYAPRIAAGSPDLAPQLARYVQTVDAVRFRFNGWAQRTAAAVTQTLDSAVSPGE